MADPQRVLGIDLGTTNSVVAVADGGQSRVLANEIGDRLIPSVVSFKPDGTILVGEEARERRLLDARNTVYSIKRLIGRPYRSPEVKRAQSRFAFELVESANGGSVVKIRSETYTLTEISAFVLREIRRVAESNLGHSVERAVITVPANFNELQRSATKAAGRVAGLEVERIINEPTAAALAYGYGKHRPERVAVFDLGGGTFDLTILELEDDVFEVLSTAGDSFLGGDDLDLAVAEVMCEACLAQHHWDPRQDQQAFERLRAAGEWVKCQLSSEPEVEVTIEELSYGAGGAALDLEFKLDKKGFEDAVRPLLGRAFDVCQQALKEAAMKPHEVDNVVLVGGSTRVPLVRQMVQQYFRKDPRTEIDPDLVVAQGAAIHGYALSGMPRKKKVAPKADASLGRMTLKKISAADLAKLKSEREKRKAELPKQPAFAPNAQVEAPPPPPRPARPTPPPPPMPGLPPVKARSPLDLDDPLAGLPAALGGLGDLDEPTGVKAPAIPPPLPPPVPPPRAAGAKPPPVPLPPVAPPSPPSSPQDLPTIDLGEPSGPRISEIMREAAVSEPPSAAQPVLSMPDRPAPLLMDVTPHSLGIETAGGYCQHLIRRNAPIPTEQARVFSTASDGQDSVVVRICQGEERAYAENQALGEIELRGLRSAPRGSVRIDVTFILDASGVLAVKAVDADTGQAQSIQINLKGGADDAAIEEMRARQQRLMQ
ncbi:MAG: Hsp70 family protein [Myxococcota bacterium]